MTDAIPTTFTFPNGRTVRRMGYGAMRLTGQPRNYGPYPDWDAGVALLRRARELGVQHIDTARAYGPHWNERIVADALLRDDGTYGDMFVASKGGVDKDATSMTRDTSAAAMARHLGDSLRDLRVGRIDLYYVHSPDGTTPIAESVAALDEARRAGKIDMIGLSNVTRADVEAAQAVAPVAAVQNRYSPADDANPEEEALIDWLAGQGIAYVPHGPLGADPMAHGAKAEPGAALQALLMRSPNVLVIPGTTNVAHLDANVAGLHGAAA
ncbi:aldo/keto reductase [Jannaschia sp. LMIT008]|uniref:aldo/keto reductase n=1 Tax=Jannaschia maritima TaxID=3032585 RepID=UPI0028122477|nr:aldo/keto reductase [Jannaschia sp. LMIT008]